MRHLIMSYLSRSFWTPPSPSQNILYSINRFFGIQIHLAGLSKPQISRYGLSGKKNNFTACFNPFLTFLSKIIIAIVYCVSNICVHAKM